MKNIFSSKPKVLVCVLTGIERHNWINPDLSLNLIRMVKDPRFDVNYYPVRDARPWETARNMTIVAARQINADWLMSFDNDNFVPGDFNPLDIIAAAGEDKHVIGLPYGMGADSGQYGIFPGPNHGAKDGPFRQVEFVGGGVLMVCNKVWQKIKGPWFRWQHVESETLAPVQGVSKGEDGYFCHLVRQHGFKVWTHERLAGHYRTGDITGMVCTMSQMGKRGA